MSDIAAKRFRALRTIFSRNLRKVRQSQPRSGTGSDCPIYQPTWPLYQELLYLADVIKPRKTHLEHKSNTSTKAVSVLKPRAFKKEDKNNNAEALVHVIAVGHNCHSLAAAQIIHIAVVPPIAFLCPQQWESTFIDNNDDHTDDSERFYQEEYDSIAENKKESSTGNSIYTGRRLTKRLVLESPTPDKFFHKKKMKNDDETNNLDKLAGALVTLSQQVITPPIQISHNQKEEAINFDSEVETFLQIIRASLHRTCTQQRIPCLMKMLNVLHDLEQKS